MELSPTDPLTSEGEADDSGSHHSQSGNLQLGKSEVKLLDVLDQHATLVREQTALFSKIWYARNRIKLHDENLEELNTVKQQLNPTFWKRVRESENAERSREMQNLQKLKEEMMKLVEKRQGLVEIECESPGDELLMESDTKVEICFLLLAKLPVKENVWD